MKKKIKDLTVDECKKICNKSEYCDNCPLRFRSNGILTVCLLSNLSMEQYYGDRLETQEVEVDE